MHHTRENVIISIRKYGINQMPFSALYTVEKETGRKEMTRKQKIMTMAKQDRKLMALFSGAVFDVVLLLSLVVTAWVWYL